MNNPAWRADDDLRCSPLIDNNLAKINRLRLEIDSVIKTVYFTTLYDGLLSLVALIEYRLFIIDWPKPTDINYPMNWFPIDQRYLLICKPAKDIA